MLWWCHKYSIIQVGLAEKILRLPTGFFIDIGYMLFVKAFLRTEHVKILKRHSHSADLIDVFITLPYRTKA